jgi:hypothetical protein
VSNHAGGKPRRQLDGREFGMLYVIGPVQRPARKHRPGLYWLCTCACDGRAVVVHGDHLTRGDTKSCGCLRREKAAAVGRSRARVARLAEPV